MNRFFRTAPQVYTAVRAGLDATWNHPKVAVHEATGEEVRTVSCLPSVADALTKDGAVYVALHESMFAWEVVQQQIAALIAGGMIEEINEQTFRAALPVSDL